MFARHVQGGFIYVLRMIYLDVILLLEQFNVPGLVRGQEYQPHL